MKNVEIRVHLIAKSKTDDTAIRTWLDDIGAVSCPWPQETANLTGPEAVVGLAAKRCYMSFSTEDGLNPNVTKVRKDWTEYLDNILKSGHGSVLEHATYTFAIEGVSRVFTGECNRHRAGVAISEGSMRYIRFTDIPWWIPTSLRLTLAEQSIYNALTKPHEPCDLTEEATNLFKLAKKKVATQESFARVFQFVQDEYTKLVALWELDTDASIPFHVKKKITSCLRRIIPLGVATGAVYSFNFRAIRHVMALRTSAAAEEEIALVFSQIAKIMVEQEPRLFGDFQQTPDGYWVPKYQKI